MSIPRSYVAGGSAAVLNGRDHPRLRGLAAKSVNATTAIGMTAGAFAKPIPPVDPNEDAGAIVSGPRADLLVVADAHFGCRASEIAVAHVLGVLGHDPPPANLSRDQLVNAVFEAGSAVASATTPGDVQSDSATTLAFALVTETEVQWASLGDSAVIVMQDGEPLRLDVSRPTYLGQWFGHDEIAELVSLGQHTRHEGDCVILATDGFVDAMRDDWAEATALVRSHIESSYGARAIAEGLIGLALHREVEDAVTIAIASS